MLSHKLTLVECNRGTVDMTLELLQCYNRQDGPLKMFSFTLNKVKQIQVLAFYKLLCYLFLFLPSPGYFS